MRRRLIRKVVSLLLVCFFVLPVSPVLAAEQTVPNAELTFAVGTSDLDVSNFVFDVQRAVYEKYGISSDKIKITKAGATIVDSKNDFNWTIYDHYYSSDYPGNGNEPVDWSVYHSADQPYFYYEEGYYWIDRDKYFTDVNFSDGSMDQCYLRSKHIYPKDDGLIFVGYSEPAFKDFMIYPDQNTSEKTIEFTIDESGVSTHTLEGAGFLFNAEIDDNMLNGYLVFYNYANSSIDLYRLSDVDAAAFHNEDYYDISDLDIPGIKLVARKGWGGTEQQLNAFRAPDTDQNKEENKKQIESRVQLAAVDEGGDDSTKDIRVQVTANSLKFYEDGGVIFDTTDGDSDIIIEDTGAGGFGPLVSYRNHSCEELSYFTFKNLTMETYRSLSFLDLINQQTWGNDTKRFIVNIDDDGVPEFSNDEGLSQITSYMKDNNVHYIGWGKNNKSEEVESAVYNKDQAEGFIDRIGDKGIFVNMDDPNSDTYQKGIDAIADYIYSQLAAPPDVRHRHSGSSGGGEIQPPVAAFSDIKDHWAQKDIEQLATLKLLSGYPDGTFRPDYTVTRAEFAAMLFNVFEYADLEPTAGSQVNFSDVSRDDWYYDCVSRMAQENVLFGYGDGTFGPEKLITREEVAAMITRMLVRFDITMNDSDLTFKDSDAISWWAKSPLGKIAPMDIIKGMPDGTFQPADNATRAQSAVMILRMLEKAGIS